MKDIPLSQESPTMDEMQMRSAFIELDVRARTVGGVENLSHGDQRLYIQFGRKTGLLAEGKARALAEKLGINPDRDWPA